KVLRHTIFVFAPLSPLCRLRNASEDTKNGLWNRADRANRILDQMLGTLSHPFPSLDRRLGEGIALMDFLQLRDRRDLTDQTAQPGVARGGERAIVRCHRIVIHKGKGADRRAQLVMRTTQQRGRHDIGGGAAPRGVEKCVAQRPTPPGPTVATASSKKTAIFRSALSERRSLNRGWCSPQRVWPVRRSASPPPPLGRPLSRSEYRRRP